MNCHPNTRFNTCVSVVTFPVTFLRKRLTTHLEELFTVEVCFRLQTALLSASHYVRCYETTAVRCEQAWNLGLQIPGPMMLHSLTLHTTAARTGRSYLRRLSVGEIQLQQRCREESDS